MAADNIYIYRLPLDKQIDKDLIDWLDSFPSKKKAEIVRYALRYYIGQLKDHEIFKLSHANQDTTQAFNYTEKVKKAPKTGLLRNLTKN